MPLEEKIYNSSVIHIVSNTHWDREWYLPFEKFRKKLIKLTDKLLLVSEDLNFKYFTFDGQTIVLEDYLAVKPDNKGKLKKFISKGKILVGPWYIQPDEFLVSGEFLIRNLLTGHIIASEFGRVMKIGYLPDSFGHISQLPQILSGFNLKDFVFMRGLGNVKPLTEYLWEGPDGSSLIAHYQIKGYGDTACLLDDKITPQAASEKIKDITSIISSFGVTAHVLINIGGDHRLPLKNLPKFIRYTNKILKNKVIHSNYEIYCKSVNSHLPEKLEKISGELRGSKYHFILPGVYSSRIHLKQDNDLLQRLLEKWAEPLSAWRLIFEKKYPEKEMEDLLKLILQNQPHDSICGCSVDRVHEDMQKRTASAYKKLNKIINNKINCVANRLNTGGSNGIIAFNPVNLKRNCVISINNTGKIHDCFPCQKTKDKNCLIYLDKIPPCGYKFFPFTDKKNKKRKTKLDIKTTKGEIENKFYKVSISSSGLIDIFDKETRIFYKGLHHFEDDSDRGDVYSFCPLDKDKTINSKNFSYSAEIIEKGPLRAVLKIKYFMKVPQELNSARTCRSLKNNNLDIVTFVKLYAGTKRIDFTTHIENKAKDHRLRVGFITKIKSKFHFSESHFDIVKRNNAPADGGGWREQPAKTHPQQRFISINDYKYGISILNKGLPEYEVRPEKDKSNTVLLTLLRCTGWLSRGDLSVRPGHAGPGYETPGAQCIGRFTFHYSLATHSGSFKKAKIWQIADDFCNPVKLKEISSPGRLKPNLKYNLPPELSFIKIKPANLVLSAVKKSIKDKNIIVRLFNISNKNCRGEIELFKVFKKFAFCNLAEEVIKNTFKAKKIAGNKISLSVPPKKIATLKIYF